MSKYQPGAYLTRQQQETYRSFIVYGPAMHYKSRWARQLQERLGAHVVDLQATFLERAELAEKIDRFRPADLERLLLELQKGITEYVIVIDNMDFLLNLWSPKRQREFVSLLDRRLKSPGTTNKTFVFVMQDHPTIIQSQLSNSKGDSRIVRLDDFEAF